MIRKKLKTLRHKIALKKALNDADLDIGDFRPEMKHVELWFKLINNAVFKGELQEPDYFEIRRRHGKWGEVEVNPDKEGIPIITLCLTDRYDTEQMFINTLCHEMVHVSQYQLQGMMDHGRYFKRYQAIFKKYNIEL
jgi:hypothetical protein